MEESTHTEMRLFIGISLTEEARDFVAGIAGDLRGKIRNVRWVSSGNLHVTLKFLGLCREQDIVGITGVMQEAADMFPLRMKIGGVGGFPSHGSARVLWVGAEDSQERATKIYGLLDKGMAAYGIKREKRKYHPHVTIGRAKIKPVKIPEEALRMGGDGMILEVGDMVLYRSVIKKTGAEYSIVTRVGTRGNHTS